MSDDEFQKLEEQLTVLFDGVAAVFERMKEILEEDGRSQAEVIMALNAQQGRILARMMGQ